MSHVTKREEVVSYPKHNGGLKPKQAKLQPITVLPEGTKQRRTGGASDYGKYYWCVKTELSDDGEIYVFADEVRFTPTGGVLFVSQDASTERVRLALAPGMWSGVSAASCFDGHAVAVERWQGEVVR